MEIDFKHFKDVRNQNIGLSFYGHQLQLGCRAFIDSRSSTTCLQTARLSFSDVRAFSHFAVYNMLTLWPWHLTFQLYTSRHTSFRGKTFLARSKIVWLFVQQLRHIS